MTIFALLLLLPLLAYLLVQITRDYRSKQVFLCVWGLCILGVALFVIAGVFRNPGY